MARDHFIVPTVDQAEAQVVRLGAGNASTDNLSYLDEGKVVKLVGESRYDLAVAGNDIEGLIYAVELAPQNGYTIGSIVSEGVQYATADGLQATPGTGSLAVGDYVVAGSITAKGTKLTAYPKVCKATDATTSVFKWRVVSLCGSNGAVGSKVAIERVNG